MSTIPTLSRETPAEVRRAIDALAQYLKTIEQSAGSGGGGQTIVRNNSTTIINQGGSNLTIEPPAQPTGLTATGAYELILLTWNPPGYRGHAHTIVYRASVNNFGQAVPIGTVGGSMYVDAPPRNALGQTYYYWIRFVNIAGAQGVINAASGTAGSTATDPTLLLTLLAGKLGYEQFDVANGVFPVRLWTDQAALPVLPSATWPAGSVAYWTKDGKMYRTDGNTWTSSVDASDLNGSIAAQQFAAGIEPVAVVDALPSKTGYTGPKVVLLTTDGKLYRFTGGAGTGWTSSVSAADMTGMIAAHQISTNAIEASHILAGQIDGDHIAANAIDAGKIAAGAILADNIAANEIITNSAQIRDSIITSAKIGSVAADKITAGTVTAPLVLVGSQLKSVDESFFLDANEKFLQITGSDNSEAILSAGDLSFLLPNGTPYKSVRRIVMGEGEYGLYVPFNPPFYSPPHVIVFLKDSLVYDSTAPTTSQFLESHALNVTQSGFTLALAHRKGGAATLQGIGDEYAAFTYNGSTFVSSSRTTGAGTHVVDVVLKGYQKYVIYKYGRYYRTYYRLGMWKVGYRTAGSTGPFIEIGPVSTPYNKLRILNSVTPQNYEIRVSFMGFDPGPVSIGSHEALISSELVTPQWNQMWLINSYVVSAGGVGTYIAIEGGA